MPGLLDHLHHRACYLSKIESFKEINKIFLRLILSKFVLFCQNLSYFVKSCLILSKFVFCCLYLSFFVNICLFFVNICQYFVFICQNLSLFVNILSKSVFICLYLSNICLYLSFFVFILSKFVNIWLSCLQNLYKSKSPKSRSPQPVNDTMYVLHQPFTGLTYSTLRVSEALASLCSTPSAPCTLLRPLHE